MPEAWLSGPVEGVPTSLMPVAHSLLDSVEEVERAARDLTTGELWLEPGGAASVGFHLRHARGSIDRLLTYARGEALGPEQRSAISVEAEPGSPPAAVDPLIEQLRETVDGVIDVCRRTGPGEIDASRTVGRAELPSTVRGLLFHAAEHTRRHAGQVVTTVRILRGLGLGGS